VDSTTLVAIAGIAGTLLAPIIAGRMQRSLLRADRVLDRRLDAYVDLLEVAGHLHENAQTWSAVPLAKLQGPPVDRIRALDARVRVVGSDSVREAMDRVATLGSRFQRELFSAQLEEARVQRENEGDSGKAVLARMGLGTLADEMTKAIEELESRIRAEMKV